MKGWSIVVALLLSLILVGSVACNPFGGTEPAASQQLASVTRGDLAITVSASGNIAVTRDMKLAFGIGGRVDKIYVAENDEVSQGEVLARLVTDALELAITQAKVAHTQAQVGVAEAAVAVARAEIALTQAKVAYTQAQVAVAEAEVTVTRGEMAVTQAQVAYTQAQVSLADAEVAITRAEVGVTQAQVAYTQAQAAVTRSQAAVTQAQAAVTQAQVALQTAEEEYRLATMLSGRDTAEVVAIKKRQVEATQQSLEAARQSLEATGQSLEVARQSEESSQQALELAKLSPQLARQSLEAAQQSLEASRQALELAKLSPALARQSLAAARQSLAASGQSLEATGQALELAKLSPEVARQSLELTEQSLEQTQQQLDKATLVAPFAGVVASLYDVDEGDTISTATTILYLVDPSRMELRVQVDELDISDVKLGQRAIIEVDALPALTLTGKVSSISLLPTVEAGVITYEVKIDFALAEGVGLRAGMSASTDIVINERSQVLLVPNRAINQDRQGNPLVEVMLNGQIEPRAVITGIGNDLQTEIVQGLNEGEQVVIEKKVKP